MLLSGIINVRNVHKNFKRIAVINRPFYYTHVCCKDILSRMYVRNVRVDAFNDWLDNFITWNIWVIVIKM